ncbi:MAG: HipA domain-containing protein [Sphaerochaetaceae bacterium]|jgi:serine/threonine-protein kinase HipA
MKKRCLHCNKLIADEHNHNQWHSSCIKQFFGVSSLPSLDLSTEFLEQSVTQSVQKGHAIPGVQKKLSLHLSEEQHKGQLTLVGYPLGYILKLPNSKYPYLPEYEHVTMHLASLAKIETVEHALYRLSDGTYAYISKRIDRVNYHKIAMEDFCQLGERLTEDKYRSSYEQLGKIVKRYSPRLLDAIHLWYLLVFSFITGNSDMHLKNFSLYSPDNTHYVLTPAYDLLPTNLILKEDLEESALTLRGKRSKLNREDFLHLAERFGMNNKASETLMNRLVSLEGQLYQEIDQSMLPLQEQIAYKELIGSRIDRLRVR